MNCEELLHYFERDWRTASPDVAPSAEISDHIAVCRECRDYLEQQEELRANLQLMKEAAPSVPATVDRAVLSEYRRHIRDLSRSKERSRKPARKIVLAALGWTAAAAFALIVAYGEVGLFTRAEHNRSWVNRQVPEQRSTQVKPEHKLITTQAQNTALHEAKRKAHLAAQQNNRTALAVKNTPLQPADFHSLMYCDELSCAGTMEVIRMEVPAEALGISSSSIPSSDLVSADVLVGPDGIARGIRPAAQQN